VKEVFRSIRRGKNATVETPADKFSFITAHEMKRCVELVQDKTGLDLSGFE
jgi:hypothetical protein